MNLIDFYRAGGSFMNLISLSALLIIFIAVWKSTELFAQKTANNKLLDLILLGGSVAVAIGLLSQIIGIVQALNAIKEAADVSPALIMDGAKISFYAPIWGFIVFIVSMIIYFILKEIIKAKST